MTKERGQKEVVKLLSHRHAKSMGIRQLVKTGQVTAQEVLDHYEAAGLDLSPHVVRWLKGRAS